MLVNQLVLLTPFMLKLNVKSCLYCVCLCVCVSVCLCVYTLNIITRTRGCISLGRNWLQLKSSSIEIVPHLFSTVILFVGFRAHNLHRIHVCNFRSYRFYILISFESDS